jgi:hypothetical protein
MWKQVLKLLGVTLALCMFGLSANAQSPQILYGAQGGGGAGPFVFGRVNPTTGAFTPIGPIGFSTTGLAFHPTTGVLYATTGGASPVSPDSLITINRATGAGTLVGSNGPACNAVADISFRADGTLFGWCEGADDLVTINLTTGLATVVADSTLNTNGSGLAFSPAGVLFYTGDGNLRTISPTTGLSTSSVPLTGTPGNPNALAFNAAGTLFGTNSSTLFTINTTTGVATAVGATLAGIDAIVFAAGPSAAPTLSEWSMILLGLLLAGTAMWAIKKRRA